MIALNLFARHEFDISLRYLMTRRTDGDVSVMTWIGLTGTALAAAVPIATDDRERAGGFDRAHVLEEGRLP